MKKSVGSFLNISNLTQNKNRKIILNNISIIIRALLLSSDKFINQKPFPFTSDTGSSISHEVLAEIIKNKQRLEFDNKASIVEKEKEAIKSLFIDEKSEDEATVFLTSSSTQANKLTLMGIGAVNYQLGERVIASKDSHIFNFEVGQPGETIDPQDKVTGKLTVNDLQKKLQELEADGLSVKMVHLDQPTKGDYFYTEAEIKLITQWAHSKKIPVSMDCERLVNYLAKTEKSYKSYTSECNVDVVTFGMQKNGGARSSAAVVLNTDYLLKNFKQRADSFLNTLGAVSESLSVIAAGWQVMIYDKLYLTNAKIANENAEEILKILENLKFDDKKLEIQNKPLTTNMIFVKFPRDFIKIFNQDSLRPDIKLSPDREGWCRIVASFDTSKQDLVEIIKKFLSVYEKYNSPQKNLSEFSSGMQNIIPYFTEKEGQEENKKKFTKEDEEKYQLQSKELLNSIETPEIIEFVREILLSDSNGIDNILNILEEALYKESQLASHPQSKINSKEVPTQFDVLKGILFRNAELYHAPYGKDEVSKKSEEIIVKLLGNETSDPSVVLTSSREQAINCALQFLEITRNSKVLSSDADDSHQKFNRNIKLISSSGKNKETGKIDPNSIFAILSSDNSINSGAHKHLVTGVLIKQPTSKGYVYTPKEIQEITNAAHRKNCPVIMDMSGFSYYLAKNNQNYADYAKNCGVDACTIGFSGLGGGLSCGIVVLNEKFLSLESNGSASIETVLKRVVKENGGKQSGSSFLAAGWQEMVNNNKWRNVANDVNKKVHTVVAKFQELKIPLLNNEPANNVILAAIPEDALKSLTEKGYDLSKKYEDNKKTFTKIKIPYHLNEKELQIFCSDLHEAITKSKVGAITNAVAEKLQEKKQNTII
jgi:threonine aldolase